MTQLSRERIEQYISDPLEYGLTRSEQMEMARRLLAAEAQEPVAYAWVNANGKKHLTRCEPEKWRCAVIVTPLYAAPQPAAVPDAIHSQGESSAQNDYYALGWNACRASMLQGKSEPVSQPYTLPQWIPCSERMPPEATMVLGRCDNDYDFVNLLGGHLKIFCMGEWRILPGAVVTHWMPLPAAPQEPTK
jgi:hypothetical protein|nr:MAG TPA: Protein of unknown function (DUF551) [Caudoviricetes sp.]